MKDKLEMDRKNKIGFLAQDVEKIVPEVVIYDDSTDIYSICYTRLVPVLVEAIKEQQLIINNIEVELQKLKGKNSQKNVDMEINSSEQNLLFQNVPNPFSENTQIEYQIAENVQNAVLNIYTLNGTQLKSIKITQKGRSLITLNGSDFNAGMYIYALLVDGQIIDTKQMVLTD